MRVVQEAFRQDVAGAIRTHAPMRGMYRTYARAARDRRTEGLQGRAYVYIHVCIICLRVCMYIYMYVLFFLGAELFAHTVLFINVLWRHNIPVRKETLFQGQ